MASKIQVDKISRNSGTPEFTIPTVDGTVGQFLKTDGSGVLSFDTVTTNPLTLTGSTNNTIPTVTGANALTGEANFTYDGNTLDIKNAGTASSINLYCETSNLHYTKIKSGPHASATSYTITLPNAPPSVSGQSLTATTAGVASWGAVGKVLQVVSANKTDTSSSGSTSFVTSGLEVTITPSATSSKIFIIANPNLGAAGDNTIGCCILRDSTELNVADAASARSLWASNSQYQYNSYGTIAFPMSYLDSPSSTSAITYKVAYKMGVVNNASYPYVWMNRGPYDTDNLNYGRSSSTITVMEIAG